MTGLLCVFSLKLFLWIVCLNHVGFCSTGCPPVIFEVSCSNTGIQIGYPWHYIYTPPHKKHKGTYNICSLRDCTLVLYIIFPHQNTEVVFIRPKLVTFWLDKISQFLSQYMALGPFHLSGQVGLSCVWQSHCQQTRTKQLVQQKINKMLFNTVAILNTVLWD